MKLFLFNDKKEYDSFKKNIKEGDLVFSTGDGFEEVNSIFSEFSKEEVTDFKVKINHYFKNLARSLAKYMNKINYIEASFQELYDKSFFTDDVLRNIGKFLFALDNIVKRGIKDIYYIDTGGYIPQCIKLVAKKQNCKINCLQTKYNEKIKKYYRQEVLQRLYEIYSYVKMFKRSFTKKEKLHEKAPTFLPYYGNHVDVSDPVMKVLDEREFKYNLIELDNIYNVTKKAMKKYNREYTELESFLGFGDFFKTKLVYFKFKSRWFKFKSSENKEIFNIEGYNLYNILKKRLRFIFNFRFTKLYLLEQGLKNIVKQTNTKLLIIMNENSLFGRFSSLFANSIGIKSLLLQHGATEDDPMYSEIHADKLAAEGQSSKDVFSKYGADVSKIILCGQPRFDRIYNKVGIKSKEEVCKDLNISVDKKILVLCTQIPECDENVTDSVCKAVKDDDSLYLIIKLHPADGRFEMFEKIVKENNLKNVLVNRDYNTQNLLNACEISLSVFSTTTLETMMLGKNTITINYTGEPDRMPYASSGAAIGVYKPEDLKDAIYSILKNEDVRKKLEEKKQDFLYYLSYEPDGKASERVADLVKTMSEIKDF